MRWGPEWMKLLPDWMKLQRGLKNPPGSLALGGFRVA
jgi:hypothetical protein